MAPTRQRKRASDSTASLAGSGILRGPGAKPFFIERIFLERPGKPYRELQITRVVQAGNGLRIFCR
jgi:hypothetical protein